MLAALTLTAPPERNSRMWQAVRLPLPSSHLDALVAPLGIGCQRCQVVFAGGAGWVGAQDAAGEGIRAMQ